MKKISAIILTVVMLFTVSACNIKDVTKMAYIGDEAFTKGEFNFLLMQAQSQAQNTASQNGDSISTDEDWNTVMIGDMTASEYVIDTVKKSMKQILVLKAKAIEEGETLTSEDLETVKTQRDSFIEQLGGRYNYEQAIAEYGFTLEDVEAFYKDQILSQKISEKYFGSGEEGGSVDVSDEEIQAKIDSDYVMAKHILIMSDESETAEGTEAEAAEAAEQDAESSDADAKKTAEDIIEQLDGGADFDTLMKSYSEDVDADGNLNGDNGAYMFTTGEMVKEFETAAFDLAIGEYTKEPVETTYGYHVIMRMPLPTQGEVFENAWQSAKNLLIQNRYEDMIDKWAEELGFAFNDKAISRVQM